MTKDRVLKLEETPEANEGEIPSEKELVGTLEDLFQAQPPESKLRIAELYGVIDEEMASSIVASMLILKDTGREISLDGEEEVETYKPFELFIPVFLALAKPKF